MLILEYMLHYDDVDSSRLWSGRISVRGSEDSLVGFVSSVLLFEFYTITILPLQKLSPVARSAIYYTGCFGINVIVV